MKQLQCMDTSNHHKIKLFRSSPFSRHHLPGVEDIYSI